MMSLRWAPSALRMPISRVRSVTVTSMMFITPMPPISSEMAGHHPEQQLELLGGRLPGGEQGGGVEDDVVGRVAGFQAVGLAEDRCGSRPWPAGSTSLLTAWAPMIV